MATRFDTATESVLRMQVSKVLGNDAWQDYLADDTALFLKKTERALDFAPESDWLLSNRAFALYLLGKSDTEVMEAYRQARVATLGRDRWQKIAIEDLEKHHDCLPSKPMISQEFVDRVLALW